MQENLARSSSRLYNIVCTLEVWRRLLRGIEDFTEAKVGDIDIFLHLDSSVIKSCRSGC